jgi:hypothetical protein
MLAEVGVSEVSEGSAVNGSIVNIFSCFGCLVNDSDSADVSVSWLFKLASVLDSDSLEIKVFECELSGDDDKLKLLESELFSDGSELLDEEIEALSLLFDDSDDKLVIN